MPAERTDVTPRSRLDRVGSKADLRIPAAAPTRRRQYSWDSAFAAASVRMRPGGRPDARAEIPEGAGTAAGLRRNALYRRSLATADVIAAVLALVAAVPLLGDDRLKATLFAALPLVVLVSKAIGLYDRDENLLHRTTLDEVPALFQMTTLYTLLIWLTQGVFISGQLRPNQVLGVWGLLFAAMLVGRASVRWALRRIAPEERCIVLGDAESAHTIRRKIEGCSAINAVVLGRATLQPGDSSGNGIPLLGDLSALPVLLECHEIERVIIAPTSADPDELLDAIRLVKALGVKVSLLPRVFEAVGSTVRFDDIEGLTLLGVPTYGLTNSSKLLKRSMDVVGAGLGLIALAPVLLTLALLVKLTSPGPVFFRQPRIGRHGEQFMMIKFRTMVEGADEQKAELLSANEADGLFKIANDPRLTDVGRALRRFSLDELPQLLNVLRGQMSLVGPRPLVPEEDSMVDGWERRRLELMPGMTGIWQVLGSARIPLSEMVKIDYLYGANWSIWLDLKILVRTAGFVLGRRGL